MDLLFLLTGHYSYEIVLKHHPFSERMDKEASSKHEGDLGKKDSHRSR